MSGNWVAISRKVFPRHKGYSDFHGDGPLQLVWCHLIAMANWTDGKSKLKGQQVTLKRGQLVTSIKELSENTSLGAQQVRTRLNYLKSTSRITSEVTSHGHLITICNYGKYQDIQNRVNKPDNKPTNKPLTNHQQTTNKPLTTSKPYNQKTSETRKPKGKVRQGSGDRLPATSKTPGSLIWEAYAKAYSERYQVEPVRNAKTNAMCAQIAKRLPAALAPQVVRFYLQHPGRFYVQSCHDLSLLVRDCEKLHTEYQKGRVMTSQEANQEERRSHNAQVLQAWAEADNE